MENEKHHIVPYKSYVIVLAVLLLFTAISVWVTNIDLGALTVFTALALATVKTLIVLSYFMHLKFDHKIYAIMVALVIAVFISVIVITFIDYSFR